MTLILRPVVSFCQCSNVCINKVHKKNDRHQSVSMVYKTINGLEPPYLSSFFNSISAVKNTTLRNFNLNLRLPRMKTKFGQNSLACRGASVWKSLSSDCRVAHIFPTFKVKLKTILAWYKLLAPFILL